MARISIRLTARRLLLVLIASVAALWILSHAAPRQIAYRTRPIPAPEADFAPSTKTYVIRLISDRGEVMVMRGWEYPAVPRQVERFSLAPPDFGAQLYPETFFKRLGFDSYTEHGGTREDTAPYWFAFVVLFACFASTFIRRRIRRGFAVESPRAAGGDK